MGLTSPPTPAKLIAGLLVFKPEENRERVLNRLETQFGPIDKVTGGHIFDKSTYYEKEMGRPLFRYFISFSTLVPPDSLPGIKLKTNEIESEFLNERGGRGVNIDPGILTLQNLVLATTKNYTHRIYLGRGIYADLTLIFQKGGYQPLPWTYPDYRVEETRDFFLAVREIYKNQMKGTPP